MWTFSHFLFSKVEFNYSWLAPAVDDYVADEWDADRQKELEMEGLPETESLWCMAQSRTHRHLLRYCLNI